MRNTSLVLVTNKETSDLAKRLGVKTYGVFFDTGYPTVFIQNVFQYENKIMFSNFFGLEDCILERLC